ncbi:MAG TPA: hypothetical protein VL691_02665 [Vicinamibacteria bacterium]|nr:hypothetical protein [Vicinamibacteria bacterium]
MITHYRHTQIGWAILAVNAAVAVLVLPGLPAGQAGEARLPLLGVLALVVLLFSTLTVEVDEAALQLRFGIGLVRRRIDLGEVGSWRAVRNPWYSGWGIRLGPRGVLWNVSGLDAVEVDLPGDRHFRVGTDEPEALVAALTSAKGGVAPGPGPWQASPLDAVEGRAWRLWLPAIGLGLAAVGGLFWSELRPPVVKVGAEGLEIDTLFYGTSCPATDITAISLESRLPRVLRKTNGFDGAGTLRGRFQVEGLGEGRLYVDEGFAPFVLVRLRQGFVILGFREPGRARALYQEMAGAWPDRLAPPGP